MAAPSTSDGLYDQAVELLEVCAAAIAEGLGGPAERAYVSPGLPAQDCCDQLAVWVAGLGEAPLPGALPGQSPKALRVNMPTFRVRVTRCIPMPSDNGEPPSAAALEDAARAIDQDLWLIWNGVIHAVRDGTLWNGRCSNIWVDQANPVDPAGGCGGWDLRFRTELGGIPSA